MRDAARLAALADSGLVGSGPADGFDRLIELAAELTGVARGCVTLVDAERTTAMSAVGFPEGVALSAPVDRSFCRFVVGTGRPLVVDDAEHDPRTAGDPAISAFSAIVWAGYAIENADGEVLGTFCLMDPNPHVWSSTDLHVLATLAQCASAEVALHGARRELAALRLELAGLRCGPDPGDVDGTGHRAPPTRFRGRRPTPPDHVPEQGMEDPT